MDATQTLKSPIVWDRQFAIAAWCLYVVSFFLPAYDNARGWQCALLQQTFWEGVSRGNIGSIHYQLLTLANLFMIASPILMWKVIRTSRGLRWMRRGAMVSLVLTGTFILYLANGMDDVKYGYYVWVGSFGIFYISLFRRRIHSEPSTAF